jgi:hypothetical protein
MKHRSLRITWSVAWGIVAVLLVALWVRSYWWSDTINIRVNGSKMFGVASSLGSLLVGSTDASDYEKFSGRWMWLVRPSDPAWAKQTNHGFLYYSRSGMNLVGIPSWLAVISTAGLAIVPWLICRFSLRTLLIATTLVAVGLGLIVWGTR